MEVIIRLFGRELYFHFGPQEVPEEAEAGGTDSVDSQAEVAPYFPLGFHAETTPDRYPWEEA